MTNEIKEILKILKKCEYGACITKHNSRVLLDYITNLQEELKSTNESIIWWQNRFNALQKENQRLQKLLDFEIERNDKKQEVIDKATEYIHEKQKIQYKYALSHIECDELEDILQGENNES